MSTMTHTTPRVSHTSKAGKTPRKNPDTFILRGVPATIEVKSNSNLARFNTLVGDPGFGGTNEIIYNPGGMVLIDGRLFLNQDKPVWAWYNAGRSYGKLSGRIFTNSEQLAEKINTFRNSTITGPGLPWVKEIKVIDSDKPALCDKARSEAIDDVL